MAYQIQQFRFSSGQVEVRSHHLGIEACFQFGIDAIDDSAIEGVRAHFICVRQRRNLNAQCAYFRSGGDVGGVADGERFFPRAGAELAMFSISAIIRLSQSLSKSSRNTKRRSLSTRMAS